VAQEQKTCTVRKERGFGFLKEPMETIRGMQPHTQTQQSGVAAFLCGRWSFGVEPRVVQCDLSCEGGWVVTHAKHVAIEFRYSAIIFEMSDGTPGELSIARYITGTFNLSAFRVLNEPISDLGNLLLLPPQPLFNTSALLKNELTASY